MKQIKRDNLSANRHTLYKPTSGQVAGPETGQTVKPVSTPQECRSGAVHDSCLKTYVGHNGDVGDDLHDREPRPDALGALRQRTPHLRGELVRVQSNL